MAALVAAGCTDREPLDPHVMGACEPGAWESRRGSLTIAGCEAGCAAGEADPPIDHGGACGDATWEVVEYDGQIGRCQARWAAPDIGSAEIVMHFIPCP